MAPSVIVIDEPELGLFPAAIDVLAEAIRDASAHCQLVLATQSVRLVRSSESKFSDLLFAEGRRVWRSPDEPSRRVRVPRRLFTWRLHVTLENDHEIDRPTFPLNDTAK